MRRATRYAEANASSTPRTSATTMVRCSVRNAASSASRDRSARNPPNGSPAAESTGAARPTRCSPRTAVAIAIPESAPALSAPARTGATAGARSSRGRVLPVTTGGSALSAGKAKNTTSEFVASWIAVARESSSANAATSTPFGAASTREQPLAELRDLPAGGAHDADGAGPRRQEVLDRVARVEEAAVDRGVGRAVRLERRHRERRPQHRHDEQRRGEENLFSNAHGLHSWG